MDDKDTAGQSPDYENFDDPNPLTDITTTERRDNADRFRRLHNDAGVGATVLVNSDSGADAEWSDEVAGIQLRQRGGRWSAGGRHRDW